MRGPTTYIQHSYIWKWSFDIAKRYKNKQFLGTTVNLKPLYRIDWENNWPLILNSNLLQVHKFDYTTPINKILKLHINHSLNAQKSKSASESGTIHNAQPLVSSKNVYNFKALNIDLLGICPSLHDSAKFSKGLGKNSDHKESLESNNLSQASYRNDSQVPNYKENHQSNPRELVQPIDSHLNPPPANIKIIKCGKCQVQLNKCKCNERCNACFNLLCTCSKQCNACKKYISKYSIFEIINDNFLDIKWHWDEE